MSVCRYISFLPQTFDNKVWAQFQAAVRQVFKKYSPILAGPLGKGPAIIGGETVAFNGCAEDENDYEPCILDKVQTGKKWIDGPFKAWHGIKTNLFPYDQVVRMVFLLASHYLGGVITDPAEDYLELVPTLKQISPFIPQDLEVYFKHECK